MSNKRQSIGVSWLLFLALVTATALMPGAAAGTASDPGRSSVSEAELQDLEFIAAARGVTLDEAIDRFAWHSDFAAAVAKIRAAFPEEFARAEISGARNAWVGFKGEAPEGALDIIETFVRHQPGVVVTQRTGLGFTELELEEAIEAAHYAKNESAQLVEAVTDFDFDSYQIVTTAVAHADEQPSTEGLQAVATQRVAQVAPGILDRITVSVILTQGVLSRTHSSSEHLGGEMLHVFVVECTSGFVVRTSTGVRGIATAGHCPNSLSDDGQSLTFMAQHVGNLGDFQWHRGPQPLPNAFYSGSATQTEANRRSVYFVAVPTIGQANLCHNGSATKRKCGMEVKATDACGNFSGVIVCNLIRMDVSLGAPTDSGGPLFYGNTAYGLVQGKVQPLMFGPEYGTYSRLDRMQNALGVSVATH